MEAGFVCEGPKLAVHDDKGVGVIEEWAAKSIPASGRAEEEGRDGECAARGDAGQEGVPLLCALEIDRFVTHGNAV